MTIAVDMGRKATKTNKQTKRPKIGFQDQLSLNAGQKYCRMLQGEHSAILSTFIKLSTHLLLRSLFCLFLRGRLKTGFTLHIARMYLLNVVTLFK